METTTDINTPFKVTDVNGNEQQHTVNELYEKMLSEAERLFGRRDMKYEYRGIAHYDQGPDIDFPIPNNLEVFTIRLCFNYGASICYQLAHETIHSLAPQLKKNTTKFEEGIAVYYSLYYIHNIMKLNWTPGFEDKEADYKEVYQKVKRLKNKNSSSFRMLKTIREQEEPSFSKLKSSQLRRIFPRSTQDDRNILMKVFRPESDDTVSTAPHNAFPQADKVL